EASESPLRNETYSEQRRSNREHSGVNGATPSGSHWLNRYLVTQFRRPSGFVGRLAGWSMGASAYVSSWRSDSGRRVSSK
ncbi:MAG: hypothetical protein ABW292_20855, partial [Vicinamibacterales bacterium]